MQVILLTDDPSLIFQIASARPDWEVIEGTGPVRLQVNPSGNSVGVAAFPTSSRALKAIRDVDDGESIDIDWVVAGDVPLTLEGKLVGSLQRPFTLEDLLATMEAVVGMTQLQLTPAPDFPKEQLPSAPREELAVDPPPTPATPLSGTDLDLVPEDSSNDEGRILQEGPPTADPTIAQPSPTRRVPPAGPVSVTSRARHPAARDHVRKRRRSLGIGSPQAIGKAVVEEIVESFSPETVALFIRIADEFRILASKGLTKAEESRRVRLDHPFVREVCGLGQSVWLRPVDRAHGLVAGISGARTDALMAVPIADRHHPIGLIVVGGSLQESQLQSLRGIAREAGRLLGVSLGSVLPAPG